MNDKIREVQGSFEEKRQYTIRRYQVNGTTVKTKVFYSDEKDRYLHIYYSCSKIERMLEGRLQNCPQGKVHLVPRSDRVMYYLRRSPSERSGVYISARDENTIRTYLQKEI